MTTPDQTEFNTLVDQGYNPIPVICEVLADLYTPLGVYTKLCNAPYSYLFESLQGGEQWGRYSIIGLPAKKILKVYGNKLEIIKNGSCIESRQVDDPIAEIASIQKRYSTPSNDRLPHFTGGLVGYFGYETIGYLEPRLKNHSKNDPLDNPDILFLFSEELVIFDNLHSKLFIIINIDPAKGNAYHRAQQRIDAIKKTLMEPLPQQKTIVPKQIIGEDDFTSGFTQQGFKDAVDKVKDYIRAGDAMQVVLSQRLSTVFQISAIHLYRALRCLNPSPYLYYLHLDDFQIVGSSPEILVKLEENKITVRPLAGTRPRGDTNTEDQALEKGLLADPKERAEHLMLIDLGRNDIGRVAEIGSVLLTDKMCIERYSHVMHIVSNVVGTLKNGLTALDVLRATFPAGTVSGAPKIRAMEIIDELEPVKRGVYSGAIGYLDWGGNIMNMAIAIRTAIVKNQILYIQVGSGIVADSVSQNEWEETMNKGRALFRAAIMAGNGLE